MRMKQPAKALRLFNEPLVIRQAKLQSRSPLVAASWTNVGVAFQELGDRQGALKAYRMALALREPLAGPDDRSVTDLKKTIAGLEKL
jgi:tetratricopeptide (TPR) repeat protein